ncbi:hypothetical protein GCM10017044_19650 [Kordiimonas sediminis]|uniref:OmpR/PhoB-type domain-containing protein n=1 Tax=Kordiimonas sediminis TaxID=1735581 RepID=A0A919ATS0_9PROT|nr:winged helix-turn-helix domain-containing protein [Kordiimonas sediminis]GHF24956.1 hypothetical protein GCM10017044_19650 [Kordiimonas sediminis]
MTGKLEAGSMAVNANQHKCMIDSVQVDFKRRTLTDDSQSVRLEPKAMEVLELLVLVSGEVVDRDQILTRIWGEGEASDESLSRSVSLIRTAFKKFHIENPIETIPRKGYRFSRKVKPISPLGSDGLPELEEDLDAAVLIAASGVVHYLGKDLSNSIKVLTEAVEKRPDFYSAWGLLAEAIMRAMIYWPSSDRLALLKDAVGAARKALEGNKTLSLPRLVLAQEKITYGDVCGAIDMVAEVLRDDPDNTEATYRLGFYFGLIGHTEKALGYLERAVVLDPLQGRNQMHVAIARTNMGDFEGAEAFAEESLRRQYFAAAEIHAVTAFAQGKFDTATERYTKNTELYQSMYAPLFDVKAYWQDMAQGMYSGCPDKRKQLMKRWCKLCDSLGWKHEGITSYVFLRIGAAEEFFKAFGNLNVPGPNLCLFFMWEPTEPLRNIRCHPDFRGFAERIGLTKAWDRFGPPDVWRETGLYSTN